MKVKTVNKPAYEFPHNMQYRCRRGFALRANISEAVIIKQRTVQNLSKIKP
ncbi:MAG: hypothetical protein LBP85_09535 [Prevotellaceae bacterium]|nr:hypothetical protein [Prevotellaceae bacterium]